MCGNFEGRTETSIDKQKTEATHIAHRKLKGRKGASRKLSPGREIQCRKLRVSQPGTGGKVNMQRKARSAKIQYGLLQGQGGTGSPKPDQGRGRGATAHSQQNHWNGKRGITLRWTLSQEPKHRAKVPPSRSRRRRRPEVVAGLTHTAQIKCFHSGKMKCFAR